MRIPLASLMPRAVRTLGLLLIANLACQHGRPAPAGARAEPTLAAPNRGLTPAPADLRQFDAIFTLESLIETPAQRQIFEVLPPTDEGGARTYGFVLSPQPGMNPSRHFLSIVAVVQQAAASKAGAPPSQSTSAGPNGSLVDAQATTSDGRFRLRVSHAMLLPASVEVHVSPPQTMLADALRRYEARIQHGPQP